jgi:DNA polymerase elongation subunit (family B)
MSKLKISPEVIEAFLNGNNPKKYVVGIEASYRGPVVDLIINDPETGKRIEKHSFKPFIWFKREVSDILFGGKKNKAREVATKYGVKTKRLQVSDDEGNTPKRLANGYEFIATCSESYNRLIQFFNEGGIDVFDKKYSKLFFMFTPVEQFMIQTGIRLFKGMDDYNDVHRFQFDLETEGLNPKVHSIFQIGMRDNRGFELVLETTGKTPRQRRDSERENLINFFRLINYLKPDIISGFNSESFDWSFIYERCERLSIPVDQIAICLDGKTAIKRKPSMLKLGNEQEPFLQTYLWGYNVIDIAHAVRRAQAINSDIKKWNLKYITKFSGVAKENRVYVKGDKIYSTWNDKVTDYAFNEKNGDYYKISERMPLLDGYEKVKGNFLVQRYLLDDLWETEQVDTIYNQAAFLISKLLPTTYSRSSTMGTASQWKLIMAAWSYENNLAIPETETKRDFTGGLSRLLRVGYSKNVVKLDYAALYPKNQLTHDIFPDLDISGVMAGLLTYIVDTRDKFKFLTGEEKSKAKDIQKRIDKEGHLLSKEELDELKKQLKEHKALASLYDKKQLPLKILANSWFGAYGAPYIFNWGDTNCAEETTCRGRQYLRLMVKYFRETHGFEPLVLDTDGCNFSFPDNIDEFKYVAKGSHWKTEKYANIELCGLEAVLAEFNETYMIGRMGLDIDDIYESTINFSRKNYANSLNGKVKLVGNSIKSKKMAVYIEDFLSKAIRLLLDGKGKEFINYYHEYVDKIYNQNIPLVKIASKSKVKTSIEEYKKKAFKKNKAGNPMPKQAHMELAILNNLDLNLGDTIYYVNTGKSKTDGDCQTLVKAKMSKKQLADYEAKHGHPPKFESQVILNCKLLDADNVESNFEILKEIESVEKMIESQDASNTDMINNLNNKIEQLEASLMTDEYNVAKYLEAFNKKVKPLLVCFDPEIRSKIIRTIKKDRKTKLEKLTEKYVFTEQQCQLVSGMPEKPTDQDDYYEDLMKMEDKEIRFWDSVDKVPNNMEVEEWEFIRADYHERKRIEREEGIKYETNLFEDILKRLELKEMRIFEASLTIPQEILMFATLSDDYMTFVSRKWGVTLGGINDIFKYEKEAIERDLWYHSYNMSDDNRYQAWLDYKLEQQVMHVENYVKNEMKRELQNIADSVDQLKKQVEDFEEVVLKKIIEEEKVKDRDDDSDDDEYDPEAPEPEYDGFIPELQRADFEVELGTKVFDAPILVKKKSPWDDEIEESVLVEPVLTEPVLTEPVLTTDYAKDLLLSLKNLPKEENNEWNF